LRGAGSEEALGVRPPLGRDVVDFLAWLELGGAASRTLDQYERDLSRGCLMFPSKDTTGLDDGDAVQIAKSFKPGERRVRVAWRSFYKWGCAHGAANEMRKKARTGFEPVYEALQASA
jgi:hypothetical protein